MFFVTEPIRLDGKVKVSRDVRVSPQAEVAIHPHCGPWLSGLSRSKTAARALSILSARVAYVVMHC